MKKPPSVTNSWERINRRGWFLWGVTFTVVGALTITICLLYLPLLQASPEALSSSLIDSYYAMTGLFGLVTIFCLYTTIKQRELNLMRRALESEEQEKDDVRTRLSELSALFQVSTTINLQLRLDVILEIIVRRVVSTLRAQQASIMIFNPETSELETRASYGLESEFARNAKKRLGEGIAGWVAARQEAVLLNEKEPPNGFAQHYKRNRKITSALSLPLMVGERCVGVLNVNRINHPDTFRDHHREMLQMFSAHVGAVIDRAELVDRMGNRARELEADNQRLTESNRMKDVFLSTASHELKTPLTSVIAYAELLDDRDHRLDLTQRGEFLGRLRSEAARLLGLIEDILDLSRIESGKLTLRRLPQSLESLVRGAVETTRATADKHRVTFAERYAKDVPTIPVDEVKLRQAVVNLLVNAVKFSPERGTVTVSVRADESDAVIEIVDSGPGIVPEETTHIFELFGQGVRESAKASGGLGIGLHLVKRIAELHGGHVGVNSTPGAGSTFWIRLPRSSAEDAADRGVDRAA